MALRTVMITSVPPGTRMSGPGTCAGRPISANTGMTAPGAASPSGCHAASRASRRTARKFPLVTPARVRLSFARTRSAPGCCLTTGIWANASAPAPKASSARRAEGTIEVAGIVGFRGRVRPCNRLIRGCSGKTCLDLPRLRRLVRFVMWLAFLVAHEFITGSSFHADDADETEAAGYRSWFVILALEAGARGNQSIGVSSLLRALPRRPRSRVFPQLALEVW